MLSEEFGTIGVAFPLEVLGGPPTDLVGDMDAILEVWIAVGDVLCLVYTDVNLKLLDRSLCKPTFRDASKDIGNRG